MLLDAETLDLAPRAAEVVAALGGDPRFTLELPASQVEIVLPPLPSAAEVGAGAARRPPRPGRRVRGRSGCAAAGRGRPPLRGAARRAQPRRALRPHPRRVRRRRPRAARLRAAGPRLRAPRRDGDGRPQRAAPVPAARRRAGRERLRVRRRATPASPRSARRSASGSRARACRPSSTWETVRATSCGGSATRPCGGGSCARTRASGRSRCASPTPRPRSPKRRRWWRSCTRSSPTSRRPRRSRSARSRRRRSDRRRPRRRPRARGAPRRRGPARAAPPRAPRHARAAARPGAPRAGAGDGGRGRRRAAQPRRVRRAMARAGSPRTSRSASSTTEHRSVGYLCAAMPAVPSPRGPLTEGLLAALAQPVHALEALPVPAPADPLADEDLQLALYVMYELHYRGLDGVDEAWEWEPSLLALRARPRGGLPARPARARRRAGSRRPSPPRTSTSRCARMAEADDGPVALAAPRAPRHARPGPRVRHPPLGLPAQGGRPARVGDPAPDRPGEGRARRDRGRRVRRRPAGPHPRRAVRRRRWTELGLDAAYGAYLDRIPALTLATVNLMSLLGLHRSRRGAIVGHLALFEMTSSLPNRRYGNALRRLGFGERATAFFDEHVEADAVHEAIASVDLAGGLVRAEPDAGRRRPVGRPRARAARGPLGGVAARRVGAGALLAARPAGRRCAGLVAREARAFAPASRPSSSAARRAEADELVRPVAERARARLAAAAQRHGPAADLDLVAVLVGQRERAAHQQRPVAVWGDDDVVGGHPPRGAYPRRQIL